MTPDIPVIPFLAHGIDLPTIISYLLISYGPIAILFTAAFFLARFGLRRAARVRTENQQWLHNRQQLLRIMQPAGSPSPMQQSFPMSLGAPGFNPYSAPGEAQAAAGVPPPDSAGARPHPMMTVASAFLLVWGIFLPVWGFFATFNVERVPFMTLSAKYLACVRAGLGGWGLFLLIRWLLRPSDRKRTPQIYLAAFAAAFLVYWGFFIPLRSFFVVYVPSSIPLSFISWLCLRFSFAAMTLYFLTKGFMDATPRRQKLYFWASVCGIAFLYFMFTVPPFARSW